MIKSVIFVLLCACGSSSSAVDGAPGGGGGDGGSDTDEPAELAGITAAHDRVRAMIQTPPALPALTWSPQLAASAAAYGAHCTDANGDGLVDHNENRSDGFPDYVGENIYASSGAASGDDAVSLWAAEGAHYHIDSNTCDGGQICGHYTQLVWRATTKVGCARVDCPSLHYPSTIICDYEPGGNFNGQKPY